MIYISLLATQIHQLSKIILTNHQTSHLAGVAVSHVKGDWEVSKREDRNIVILLSEGIISLWAGVSDQMWEGEMGVYFLGSRGVGGGRGWRINKIEKGSGKGGKVDKREGEAGWWPPPPQLGSGGGASLLFSHAPLSGDPPPSGIGTGSHL